LPLTQLGKLIALIFLADVTGLQGLRGCRNPVLRAETVVGFRFDLYHLIDKESGPFHDHFLHRPSTSGSVLLRRTTGHALSMAAPPAAPVGSNVYTQHLTAKIRTCIVRAE